MPRNTCAAKAHRYALPQLRPEYVHRLCCRSPNRTRPNCRRTHDFHFDVRHEGAKRVRMNFQRLTHTAIVAVGQPHDDGDASGSTAVEIDRPRSVCIYYPYVPARDEAPDAWTWQLLRYDNAEGR